MGLGQLDRAEHRVASDHRHDERGPLVPRSHGLAFPCAESRIVAGVHDDRRAGLDRGPIGAPLGQADSSAVPVVQSRAVFDRHDADKLFAIEPVDGTTGDVQKFGETVGGRFQDGLDLEARRQLTTHRGDQRLTARLFAQGPVCDDRGGTGPDSVCRRRVVEKALEVAPSVPALPASGAVEGKLAGIAPTADRARTQAEKLGRRGDADPGVVRPRLKGGLIQHTRGFDRPTGKLEQLFQADQPAMRPAGAGGEASRRTGGEASQGAGRRRRARPRDYMVLVILFNPRGLSGS